jgi:hypothetical protein
MFPFLAATAAFPFAATSVIAATAVHTEGVNWESTGALLSGIGVLIMTAAGYVAKRSDARNAGIQHQVETVAAALASRMDKIDSHLDQQDRTVAQQGERLARVEGQLFTAAGLTRQETARVAARERAQDALREGDQ